MKQEYKEMMIKYLDAHPGLEVTSNPIGWYRQLEMVDDETFNDRLSPNQLVRYGKVEHAMISVFLKNQVPSCTSYKFIYDKEQKAFVGKIKLTERSRRSANVEIDIPNNIWFDNADINITVKGKSSIKCDVKLNVRNGMFPKDIDDAVKKMQDSICKQISDQLKGKGRVSISNFRKQLRFSEKISMYLELGVGTQKYEDLIIKL